jgi:superfamily I DNA and RNA helicase
MDFSTEIKRLRCRLVDYEEARTTTHQEALLILAQTFDYDGVTILCEPSVVGAKSGAPDIVVIDPLSGAHIFEVKGVHLDQIRAVNAGGAIEITYQSSTSRKDPSRQARQSMFDLKDAASRHFNGDLNVPFHSWVIFPSISRSEWDEKFGEAVSTRSDVLFSNDLLSSDLKRRLQHDGIKRLSNFQMTQCPALQMRSIMAAFGDSEILKPKARTGPLPPKDTKGRVLSEINAETPMLSKQQQSLTSRVWDDGPRLLRGVAGSGKTVVLATQVARMVERLYKGQSELFNSESKPFPILAVCFNRTLVPFIREKIETAYRQRTGDDLPDDSIYVTHLNALLWKLSQRGYCGYYKVSEIRDAGKRAEQYLSDLNRAVGDVANRLSNGLFHSIYIDEGQDFHENDYRVLLKLCCKSENGQPRMFVFYDDAQNLYGLPRPTWSELGLELRGRSVVMDECFRNTRQIVEPAFNILIGTHANDPQSIRTRGFADIQTLKEKELISFNNGHIAVHFSSREGDRTSLQIHQNRNAEVESICTLCEELVGRDGLLPQDLLILTYRRDRASEIAFALANRLGSERVRCAFGENEKDKSAIQDNQVTVSTVATAKGYDAPYVVVSSIHDFPDDIEGRVSLYVACTRAREWLTISSVGTPAVTQEFQRALEAQT